MSAAEPRSDEELIDMVYGYADGQAVCGESWCPNVKGSYCLECHSLASWALDKVRRRIVDGLIALAVSP